MCMVIGGVGKFLFVEHHHVALRVRLLGRDVLCLQEEDQLWIYTSYYICLYAYYMYGVHMHIIHMCLYAYYMYMCI